MISNMVARSTYFFLIAYGLLILAALPLGFDQHHSGLILASLNEYGVASASNSAYPFNQYGPAWTLIFHDLLLLAPGKYFFLSIKVLGISLIFISILIQYKLARLFLSREWSLLSISWIVLTYPFFGGFLPWPSLLVMPIIPYISYVLVKLKTFKGLRFAKGHLGLVGILLGISLFTRAQIGLSLLIATIFFAISSNTRGKKMQVAALLFGFLGSTSFIAGYLLFKGWLMSAFYDEFVLGFKYVSGDKSTFPKPIGTIVLVTFFFLLTVVTRKLRPHFINRHLVFWGTKLRYLFPILVVSMVLIFWNERIFNRLWISFLIYIYIRVFLERALSIKRGHSQFTEPLNIVVVFSGIALLQVWPLFDQMHTWWAITPSALLVGLFFQKIGYPSDVTLKKSIVIYPVLLSILIIQILNVGSTYKESSQIDIEGLAGNFSFHSNVKEMQEIQSFFEKNIDPGSHVLNLCANGNLFFVNKLYTSASRNVVFWSTMKDDKDLFFNMLKSKPHYIIACNYTPFTSQLYDFAALQNSIIGKTLGSSRIVSELRLDSSRTIKIIIEK